MAEILEVLKGWVSVDLNGVVVLRTMVERRVHPLKLWPHLLCDYTRVGDPSYVVAEEIEDDAVIEWMSRLVGTGIIVTIKCAIMAFSGVG